MLNRPTYRAESGLTLIEMIVSLTMFSVIGLSIISFTSAAFRSTAMESRASLAVQELRNALQLMSTELRMSAAISPYIVGNTASTVTCSAAFSLTATTIKFLVVQDEGTSSTAGIQPYYVGYRYDATTKQLLRGEIAGSSITNCTPPSGDPTASSNAKVLAENVVAVDTNGNGTVESAFTTSSNSILVNLGIQVQGPQGLAIEQAMPLSIYRRIV